MSTKEQAELVRQRAIDEVKNKLRHQQAKLRMSIDCRTFDIKRLTEKQAQEKRELAELGKLINKLDF